MKQKRSGRASSSEQIIRDSKRKTRKQYSAEEKIRIVLDGLRGEERIVVLNRIARSVIESERGKNCEHVFTYNGAGVSRINNHAWRKARERAGLPLVRVHDLRHTFGHRLRAAGISLEDRQDLLGHRSGRITTHYSAPDLSRLLRAVDSICQHKRATVLRLAGGVDKNPGKIPAVSNAAKSSALVS
jgi:integrase